MSENKNYWGDLSYDELWDAWAAKYSFGTKGEMTLSEARELHRKWKALGSEARRGTI